MHIRCLAHYKCTGFVFLLTVWLSASLAGQNTADTLPAGASLPACINYALRKQPLLQQVRLDEKITEQNIKIALFNWFPQLSANANFQHYFKLPVSIFPDLINPLGPKREITIGVKNTSSIVLSADQAIYNTELLFAAKTARDIRKQARTSTESSKIDLVVNVSKAFYDVLLSEQQISVLNNDIQRLEKNYNDAYNLYRTGISDKTDYQRATISLNNTKAQRRSAEETIKVKYAYLKQIMGYPPANRLTVFSDSAALSRDIFIDTLQSLNFENRVEYQLQQLSMRLQKARNAYYRWSFLPTLSAFADYNIDYQNDKFSQLYNKSFRNSLIGLNLSVPIFTGTNRLQNLKKSKLQYNRLELGLTDLKSQINTQYTQALSSYKSNLNELFVNRNNIVLAQETYNIIKLQYNQGIKSYLDVIVAENDLRTAQFNYQDILFQVLSNVVDVKQSLGIIVISPSD